MHSSPTRKGSRYIDTFGIVLHNYLLLFIQMSALLLSDLSKEGYRGTTAVKFKQGRISRHYFDNRRWLIAKVVRHCLKWTLRWSFRWHARYTWPIYIVHNSRPIRIVVKPRAHECGYGESCIQFYFRRIINLEDICSRDSFEYIMPLTNLSMQFSRSDFQLLASCCRFKIKTIRSSELEK